MGWSGNWNIKYNGTNSEKFVNLSKMIIPNYVKRFEETEKGKLECIRKLYWYSADKDIATIMEYLGENDTINVTIDGETHPISGKKEVKQADENDHDYITTVTTINKETGISSIEKKYHFWDEDEDEYEYYDYEEQTFRKEDGKVVIDNEHPDEYRMTISALGIRDMLSYQVAHPNKTQESELNGDADTIDSYIKYLANELSDDEEMMPILSDFLFKVFNPTSLKLLCEENYSFDGYGVYPNTGVLDYIAEVRKNFETPETTKSYLESIKEKSKQQEEIIEEISSTNNIPTFLKNMNKRDIRQLGGMEVLLELVEKKGEESAKEMLSILGYEISDEPSLEELDRLKAEAEVTEKKAKGLLQEYESQLSQKVYED